MYDYATRLLNYRINYLVFQAQQANHSGLQEYEQSIKFIAAGDCV